jgi:hypothetical protein
MATRPTISVIIAAAEGDAARGFADIVSALRRQEGQFDEILVVGPDRFDAPNVRWVQTSEPLVPMRWARGIQAATSDVALLTTSQMFPDDRWVATATAPFTDPTCAATGGPIDPPRRGGAVAWACFFLRYNAYLSPPTSKFVNDLAADNAAYRRSELISQKKLDGGFWEPEFHRVMLAKGLKLVWSPDMRVQLLTGPPMGEFMRQRFEHGTRFGRNRLADAGFIVRAARVATSPLIPGVFLAKIVRRVVTGGRHIGRFLYALPAMMCLLLAWSLGEMWGYLTPQRDRHARSVHAGDAGDAGVLT